MLNDKQMKAALASPLFKGIERGPAAGFLRAANAALRRLDAGETVLEQGERQTDIYVLLSGAARGEKLTADGRSIIINEFLPGHVFGDMLSGASEESPVTVKMTTSGEIISIPFSALLAADSPEGARERVLRNLIGEIAHKYLALLRRLDMILVPTLRGKIANYLLFEGKNGSKRFTVPHTREEQAQLLDCDRSALSRELSRMKKEGLIDYEGGAFEILDESRLRSLSR